MGKRRVVIVTDGDSVAQESIELIARKVNGRCVSLSGGNPTPVSGPEAVSLIFAAARDPVFVMVDDRGESHQGRGEAVLKHIAGHPDIEVLGVVAVASNTERALGTEVDFSVTNRGRIIDAPVDKYGNPAIFNSVLKGDTVDVLNELNIPIIVGVGDVGKQAGADSKYRQVPVTSEAVEEILRRSGIATS